MLPPFIIEQIRKREEEERLRRDADQPRVELPLDIVTPNGGPASDRGRDEDDVDRGVVILDLC
jgi:hypothetical protein